MIPLQSTVTDQNAWGTLVGKRRWMGGEMWATRPRLLEGSGLPALRKRGTSRLSPRFPFVRNVISSPK
jgi:hypothetical protein